MGFFFEKIAVVDNDGVRSEIELKNSELQGKIKAVMTKQTQSTNTL